MSHFEKLLNSKSSEIDDTNLENTYRAKPIIFKAFDFGKMLCNTCAFYTQIVPNLLINSPHEISINKTSNRYEKKWNQNNSGLYIVIHGLFGSPKTVGYKIAKIVGEINKNKINPYEIILPNILNKGNCSLATASEPLLNLLIDYIQTYSLNPIHIIGVSNGSRIASWIEAKLRDRVANIRITAIVGAYDGSTMITNYGSYGLQYILDSSIISNFTQNSYENTNLKQLMRTPIKYGSRHYEFYTTANDWYIPNFDSTQPKQIVVTSVEYHELDTNYDHVSLGWYKAEQIMENSIKWMWEKKYTKY